MTDKPGIAGLKQPHQVNMFSGKILLITGGTGTFGNAVLSRFLQSDIAGL